MRIPSSNETCNGRFRPDRSKAGGGGACGRPAMPSSRPVKPSFADRGLHRHTGAVDACDRRSRIDQGEDRVRRSQVKVTFEISNAAAPRALTRVNGIFQACVPTPHALPFESLDEVRADVAVPRAPGSRRRAHAGPRHRRSGRDLASARARRGSSHDHRAEGMHVIACCRSLMSPATRKARPPRRVDLPDHQLMSRHRLEGRRRCAHSASATS